MCWFTRVHVVLCACQESVTLASLMAFEQSRWQEFLDPTGLMEGYSFVHQSNQPHTSRQVWEKLCFQGFLLEAFHNQPHLACTADLDL